MARFEIDIDYPVEKMQLSRKRCQAWADFGYVDRVPVGFCLVPRYFADRLGLTYSEFFKDAQTQYYWQLQFAKFRIERIPEDVCCMGPSIEVRPYFDNVINASAFGAEIIWPENETLHAIPTIKTLEQMDGIEVPSPEAGLWGTQIDWWRKMKEYAAETKITFNGKDGRVTVGPPLIGGEGPHMTAIDIVGEDFYWWQIEYPEACERFLGKITEGMIQAEKNFRRIDPAMRQSYGTAEDSAQIMSVEMFRRFAIPYDEMLYSEFGTGLKNGRGMHMCGDSNHLLEALANELRITSFNVFGSRVSPRAAAEKLGGKALLWGNIDPVLLLNGTKDQVKQACMEALDAMTPCGGLMLGDGANICPGTPLENLAAFTDASQEYGLPCTHRRQASQ